MTVVGRHDDQRFPQVDHLGGGADRLVERLGVGERAIRIALVVGMVDPTAFNHQEVPSALPTAGLFEQVDRLDGHLRDAGFASEIGRAIGLELHVAALEQTEDRQAGLGQRVEAGVFHTYV